MKNIILGAGLLVALIVVAAPPAAAATATGRLLCGIDNTPFTNVVVTVQLWTNGVQQGAYPAVTDTNGAFTASYPCSTPLNGELVVSTPACPSQIWHVPTTNCSVNLGDLVCGECQPCARVPANLVLWLPLRESAGPVAQNLAGGNSGTHFDGTNVATPGFGPVPTNEYVFGGLCFDGTNDLVSVPSYPEIEFGTNDFTVAAWVKNCSPFTGLRTVLDHRAQTSSNTFGFRLAVNATNVVFEFADGTAVTNVAGAATLTNGQWHHLAVTVRRGASQGGRIFVDGDLRGSFSTTNHLGSISSFAPLRVGHSLPLGGSAWRGYLDEVMLACGELSPDQVASLQLAGTNGACQYRAYVPPGTPVCSSNAFTICVPISNSTRNTLTFTVTVTPSSTALVTFCPPSYGVTVLPGRTVSACVTAKPHGAPSYSQQQSYTITGTSSSYGGGYTFSSSGNLFFYGYNRWPYRFLPSPSQWMETNKVVFTITNDAATNFPVRFRIRAVNGRGEPAFSISLNGLAPTQAISGLTVIAPGAASNFIACAQFVKPDPLGTYSIVLEIDPANDGQYGAAISTELQNVIRPTCQAAILTQPSDQFVQPGDPASFTVVAASPGTNALRFQWRRNGLPIAGATNNTYAITAVATNDLGAYDVVIVDATCGAVLSDPAQLSFLSSVVRAAAPLPTARHAVAAAVLPLSGQVLAAGGAASPGPAFLTTAEIFDPAANSWLGQNTLPTVLPLPRAHRLHAVVLDDGDVLVAGDDDPAAPLSSFRYQAQTGLWQATSPPNFRHVAGTLTKLITGEVLLAGGHDGASATFNSAEWFAPANSTWTALPPMAASRFGHTATALPSGDVLVAGGAQRSPALVRNTAEFFNAFSRSWQSVAPLLAPRMAHAAILLPNGQVLVAGGLTGPAGFNHPTNSAELYDPVRNVWSPAAPMSEARAYHAAVLLPSGRVLIIGGERDGAVSGTTEIYHPARNAWQSGPPLLVARVQHGAVTLTNGAVLVLGGLGVSGQSLASTELLTLDGATSPLPSLPPLVVTCAPDKTVTCGFGDSQAGGSVYSVLRNFSPTNGIQPRATVIEGRDGALYGTTYSGGSPGSTGVVFRLNKDGSGYQVLHHFLSNGFDGRFPAGPVADGGDGALYGTASGGGSQGVGTLFKLNKDGSDFATLYHFTNGADGRTPLAGLLAASDGALYGTASRGGANDRGTVFKLNKDGSGFRMLHSFTNTAGDGNSPQAELLEGRDGRLYGTTYEGGGLGSTGALGTVFTLEKSGSNYAVLHRFATNFAGAGRYVRGGLAQDSAGALYGTTYQGGSDGEGTVFTLDTNGSGFATLKHFLTNGVEGQMPRGNLALGPDGALYGTTEAGGANVRGTIYKLNRDGSGFALLRTFVNVAGDRGQQPYAGLTLGSDGAFYGTTRIGNSMGDGIVFKLACAAPWSFDPPVVLGSCAGTNAALTVLSTVTNGVCPRLVTRTWRVTDACANSATCFQTVTLMDATPPALACLPLLMTNISGSNVVVSYPPPAVANGALLACAPPSGSVFPLGVTTVTCTATNACLANSCAFPVTVQRLPCLLHAGFSSGTLTLTWPCGGVLQKSSNLINWIDLPGAVSPYTSMPTNSPSFYRVRQ